MKIMVMTPDKALHLLSFVVVLEMDQVGEKQCHDELFLIKRLNALVGKDGGEGSFSDSNFSGLE